MATQLLEKGNSQYADIVVVKSIGKSFSEQVNDDFAEVRNYSIQHCLSAANQFVYYSLFLSLVNFLYNKD